MRLRSCDRKTDRCYKPLRPIVGYPGGKTHLAKRIVGLMPPHKKYVEPFFGMGAVFWAKPPAEREVISDKWSKGMGALKQSQGARQICCDMTINKARWERIRRRGPRNICELRFFLYHSYGAKGGNHQGARSHAGRYLKRWCAGEHLERLGGVTITSGDFATVSRRHDAKDTLFYMDPPYHDMSCAYGATGGCSMTPERVADVASRLKGKVIVTYNDHPEVRRAFRGKGFKIRRVMGRYHVMNETNNQPAPQLIITKGIGRPTRRHG